MQTDILESQTLTGDHPTGALPILVTPRTDPDADAVKLALEACAEDLFRQVWGEPERSGAKQWRAKVSAAVSMEMRGAKRGLWRDHRSGEGGDLLDLYAVHFLGLQRARPDFRRVLEEAGRWAGVNMDAPPDLRGLEERRRKQKAQAQRERQVEAKGKAALVAQIARRAQRIGGSPAAAYLASRGITALPAEVLAYLPPVPGLGVKHSRYGALLVWGRDDAGQPKGGQRILVLPDGSRAPEAVRKPSFGLASGFPARFPARAPLADDALLCVAEGPESALAVWQATGLETWAVFGASLFANAPLPLGRRIILCPDRDALGSPAAKAFAAAVEHHLSRGCELWQADAPELQGSKRDLADTLLRAGEAAVREAVATARSLRPEPPKPFNPAPEGSREDALGRHPQVVASFFSEALSRVRAAREVAAAYDLLPDDLDPRERRRQQAAIRKAAQGRHGC